KGVYWVGARAEGVVEDIAVSPGDHVHKGQLLLQLGNPQLVRQLRDMELDFEAREAELQASDLEQDSQLLALATDIANAALDFQLAQKEFAARHALVSRGAQIIPALELSRAELLAEQYRQRWLVLQQQYGKLQ